jgi:hypothetical protein
MIDFTGFIREEFMQNLHFIKRNQNIIANSFLLASVLFGSCAPSSEAEKDIKGKPEITFQFASLSLGNLNRRIEKKNINELVRLLKNEKVEILAVQELSRYPGVSTRVDFVDEFGKQTEWASAFGEMANLAGKQTGNVVFSFYPIISQNNRKFDNIHSANFEAALEATVDAGVRTITVVSAQIPAKASTEEQSVCIRSMNDQAAGKSPSLILISGNLPSSDKIRKANSLSEIEPPNSARGSIPKVWYTKDPSIRLMNSRIIETDLGKILIAEIGLFK